MSAKVKLLVGPALSYWTRWQGSQMGFTELFEALEPYVSDLQKRWQQCYRCKRGLTDTSEHKSSRRISAISRVPTSCWRGGDT